MHDCLGPARGGVAMACIIGRRRSFFFVLMCFVVLVGIVPI